MDQLVQGLSNDIQQQSLAINMPSVSSVSLDHAYQWLQQFKNALFPGVYHSTGSLDINTELTAILTDLRDGLLTGLQLIPPSEGTVNVDDILTQLPVLRRQLQDDIIAIFNGDPAAKSYDEVVRAYPSFEAIMVHRIAHELMAQGWPVLARMFSGIAHRNTGIDIHPGARIGSHFCIDHGTGVVIGETAVIGNHVKMYQGVTIGALSVSKSQAHQKRHPTIHDHVTIYARTTILGGNTVIGEHTIIGGNVWLTRSVPPHSKIYNKDYSIEHSS